MFFFGSPHITGRRIKSMRVRSWLRDVIQQGHLVHQVVLGQRGVDMAGLE